jgi:hypothetical protein
LRHTQALRPSVHQDDHLSHAQRHGCCRGCTLLLEPEKKSG